MWVEDLEKEYNKNLIKRAFTALAIIAPIILLIILVYYSKLIQSMLNISPYYDKSKEIKINQAKNQR